MDEMAERECDCCGNHRWVTRTWAFGIETFACDPCRGIEDDESPEGEHT